jgi:hypothetical protein
VDNFCALSLYDDRLCIIGTQAPVDGVKRCLSVARPIPEIDIANPALHIRSSSFGDQVGQGSAPLLDPKEADIILIADKPREIEHVLGKTLHRDRLGRVSTDLEQILPVHVPRWGRLPNPQHSP